MSKNFPPASGHTKQVARRSADPVSALTDFCYSLEYQRTLDVDMVGFTPRTNRVCWVLEAFATPTKNITVTAGLARQLGVPFIALFHDRHDTNHESPVAFEVHYKGQVIRYERVSWADLKKILEKIARKMEEKGGEHMPYQTVEFN